MNDLIHCDLRGADERLFHKTIILGPALVLPDCSGVVVAFRELQFRGRTVNLLHLVLGLYCLGDAVGLHGIWM